MSERAEFMNNAAEELKTNKEEYARDITLEMGKPISQSISEIEKCAWVCEYYAKHADEHLADRLIDTDAQTSYVSY